MRGKYQCSGDDRVAVTTAFAFCLYGILLSMHAEEPEGEETPMYKQIWDQKAECWRTAGKDDVVALCVLHVCSQGQCAMLTRGDDRYVSCLEGFLLNKRK